MLLMQAIAIPSWAYKTLLLLAGAAAVFWICTFKLMDRDFWWHITAGKMILESWSMIDTDPFAHTRAGLPYLATHEWLAQIILWLIYDVTGATGMILFRGIVACAALGMLLSLCTRYWLFCTSLAVWAAVITKGSYLERPQLFTFLFFAAFIVLAFRFLDSTEFRSRIRICITFVLLEFLWVNMHGGAALLGGAVVTFLLLQSLFSVWRKEDVTENMRASALLAITGVLMGITLVMPPNGFENITYVINLLSDQTIVYIAEWQPRALGAYLADLWPFWLLALFALLTGRRRWIFNVLLLAATAYLSRQAIRHEILFVYASLATCFYQLPESDAAHRFALWLRKHSALTFVCGILLMTALGWIAYQRSFSYERRDDLFGYGQFDFARGAANYLEQKGIQGNMFNTYGIGGYFIHRGFPVFIDGRNVDYGMDFMTLTYAAGINEKQWNDLVERYNITYAVVDYDAIRLEDHIPYSMVLDDNAEWTLTYMDDWTAVYLKNIPENDAHIHASRYAILNPTRLQFHADFSDVTDTALLTRELERMRDGNPEGVKAEIALAKLALRENRLEDAKQLAEEALAQRAHTPEAYAIIGEIAVHGQQWRDAADAYVRLLSLAGNEYPDINYGYIANVLNKGGKHVRARYYAWKAGIELEPFTPQENAAEDEGGLMVNPALDALELQDEALKKAENGAFDEAKILLLDALKLHPGDSGIWNNLCALHIQMKEAHQAIEACDKAIKLQPDFGDAHFNLSLAYFDIGFYAQAEESVLTAQKYGRTEQSDVLLQIIRKRRAQ